jgi:NADPH:quinone reductase-like Zn-dependent oxidoreductase
MTCLALMPEPEPRDGDVLVRVHAAGVNTNEAMANVERGQVGRVVVTGAAQ